MTTPKRHHYLPEAYLTGFTRGGSDDSVFYVYDRDTAEVRVQTPRNTGVKSRYCRVRNAAGEESVHVEEGLARIEGLALPVIRKTENAEELDVAERQTLALFVALLSCRVPQFERGFREITDELHKRIAAKAFSTVTHVASELRKQGFTAEEAEQRAPELFRLISTGDYDVLRSKESVVRHMLQTASEEGGVFSHLDWIIVHAPERASFITTGAPLLLLTSRGWRPQFPYLSVGLLTPGAMKFVPLTARTALMMVDRGETLRHVDVSSAYAREANLNLVARCERFVIGRDKLLVHSLTSKVALTRGKREKLFTVR